MSWLARPGFLAALLLVGVFHDELGLACWEVQRFHEDLTEDVELTEVIDHELSPVLQVLVLDVPDLIYDEKPVIDRALPRNLGHVTLAMTHVSKGPRCFEVRPIWSFGVMHTVLVDFDFAIDSIAHLHDYFIEQGHLCLPNLHSQN